MATINVPAKRRRRPQQTSPPAGVYEASVKSAVAVGVDFVVTWEFRTEGQNWALEQRCDAQVMADILFSVGFAGQAVDHRVAIGETAYILVCTCGGHCSAYVDNVWPREPDLPSG